MNRIDIERIQILGSTGHCKQLCIDCETYQIAFKDAMNYVTPCTLDAATKDYGQKEIRVKGVFPYSKLRTDTLKKELLRTKPFEQSDFFSDLKQEGISDEDYQKYLEDYKRFKNFYE